MVLYIWNNEYNITCQSCLHKNGTSKNIVNISLKADKELCNWLHKLKSSLWPSSSHWAWRIRKNNQALVSETLIVEGSMLSRSVCEWTDEPTIQLNSIWVKPDIWRFLFELISIWISVYIHSSIFSTNIYHMIILCRKQ